MEQQQLQQGLGGAGGPGAAAAAGAGPGLDDGAFWALLRQAYRGETAALLAAVDQDKRLATRASGHGITLLHRASERGSVELVGGLLDRGVSISAKNEFGWDALYYACVYRRLAVATMLLDRGADPNTSSNRCTALGIAARDDYHDVCLLLLSRSADLMAVMPYGGRTALEMYGEDKHPPLIPAELAARRAALVAAWEEGPHPSQVQRRKDVRFAPRAALMTVVVGCGFVPLEARRLAQSLARASLGPEAAAADFFPVVLDTAEKRRAYRLREILSNVDLARRVASFL